MPTGMTLRTIMGLVMVIIVLSLTGCFISSYLNPKCDLSSKDAYDDFVELYRNCVKINTEDVCKCGEFDIQEMTPNHKIMIVPFKEDNVDKISISLFCNGRFAGSTDFGDYENPEKVRVYFSDPENFEEAGNLDMQNLRQTMRDNTDSTELNRIYRINGDEIRKSKEPMISEKILGNGFEIIGHKTYHYIRNIGLLFGVNDPLTLVNYKGKVAFMAKTLTQGKKDFIDC